MTRAAGGGRAHVFYAMKANGNLGVLKTLAALGAGADTVSEGEVRKALAAGFPPERIVFSGVGKAESELRFAVEAGIYQVNIETESELDLLSRVAAALGKRQEAVFRVNPDIGAGGHAKITTGSSENKFGVSFEEVGRLYARAANLPGVRMMGLALHIGSQIRETESFEAAYAKMAALVGDLRSEGHRVERLDLGGGLGIPYDIPREFDHGPGLIDAYADMVARVTQGLEVELGFEPGRLIVGNAGILMTRVLHLNPRPSKQFLVVDAAMNDLVRPAMYEAYHEIWPVAEPRAGTPEVAYDVVGPICESGDTFTTGRVLPALKPGDLIAFMTAGAYGASMASTYNQRLLVPEVLVKGADYAVTRPRQSFEELLGTDRAPPWLA
ncbi:MAG: diaminopimelate decarboxylase [Bosea sp. 32-68-6]|nr:MAG: diaminopimelate decarboxylase [Bosea sp. 32-68-6]